MIKIIIREANHYDLPSVIQLLADDPLGAHREDSAMPPNAAYQKSWEIIHNSNNTEIFVVEADSSIIGVAQIDYLHYLTYQGGCRAQVEGVRIHHKYRSHGIGEQLFQFLIEKAKQRGCHLVQLTTDKSRPGALKFYEKLGFVASHTGMKLHLDPKNV